MKLTKPLFAIIAGLIVSLTGLLQAQVTPGSVSISGGPPSSPQTFGTTNWIQYSAAISNASDNVCETLHPSNTIVAWGTTYGSWRAASNNPTYYTNVFPAAGWYTNDVKCTVTFSGTDCNGNSYSTNAIVNVTNVIQVVVPSINLGTSNIWWFNGESPSGYTMQTTASVSNAPSGSTFAWSISGTAAIVGSSTNSIITITNTGASVSNNDVSVQLVINGWDHVTTNLTVLAPKSLNFLSNNDQIYGYGYISQIHYQILDQFGHLLPSSVPWNEDIDTNGVASTAPQVTTAAIADYTGENWPWGEEDGWDGKWVVNPNDAYDSIWITAPSGVLNPNTSNPQTPLSSVKIAHSPSGGSWYVGTTGDGGIGVKVKTLEWQRYQDHGRHQ
jgi:hypothetical protein